MHIKDKKKNKKSLQSKSLPLLIGDIIIIGYLLNLDQ